MTLIASFLMISHAMCSHVTLSTSAEESKSSVLAIIQYSIILNSQQTLLSKASLSCQQDFSKREDTLLISTRECQLLFTRHPKV